MNILIVDDEYLIVQGIYKNTDWDSLGISQVFCAYSARQAKAVFQENPIDLLLSDIEMPKESGLELIQWVKENGFPTICLMLTGHQNFDYAHQALNMQVFRYILKPVEISVLEEALQNAVGASIAAQKSEEAMSSADAWNKNKDHMIHTFWKELFLDKEGNQQEIIRKNLSQLQLPEGLAESWFCFIQIRLLAKEDEYDKYQDNQHQDKKSQDENKKSEAKKQFIKKTILDMTKQEDFVQFIVISEEEYVAVLKDTFCENSEAAYEYCTRLLDRMQKERENWKFTLYLACKRSLREAYQSYQQFSQYEKTIFSIHSMVIPVEGEPEKAENACLETDWERLKTSQWTESILRYHSEFIPKSIAGFFQDQDRIFSVKMLLSLYHQVLKSIFRALESLENGPDEALMDEFLMKVADCTDVASAVSSPDDFLLWTKTASRVAEDILKEKRNASSFVAQINQMIRENISSEDLNRNTIASALHMNPDYLSHLFHKQTGELLNNYITKERISAAKIMLLNTDLSLQEISWQTGFSNSSYFHKQFKRFTGVTPNQYRQKK